MSNHCATCAHFIEEAMESSACWVPAAEGWGECRLAISIDGAPFDESLAVALDADTFKAGLVVRPDFGCVQWEAK